MTAPHVEGRASADPLRVLLDGPRKLGWEYVDPGDPPPSPLLRHEPLMRMQPVQAPAPGSGGSGPLPVRWIVGLGVLTVVLLPFLGRAPWLLIFPVTGAGMIVMSRLAASSRGPGPASWEQQQALARQQYEQEMARWRQEIATHDAQARAYLAQQPLWWPVTAGTTGRLDVVGGLPDGWMHLLATFGAGMLAAGEHVLVLDLSGLSQTPAAGLLEIAASVGPTRMITLPGGADSGPDLLGGLTPEEIADLLAAAVGSMRESTDRAAQMTDSDLLFRAIRSLDGPVTPQRVLAAVEILGRTSTGSTVLSDQEIIALSDQVDLVGSGETVQERLRLLRIGVGMLARSGAATDDGSVADLWAGQRLTVLRTSDPHRHRKEFVDQVLVLSVLQTLRRAEPAVDERRSLILLGADGLGERTLDDLARQTGRLGIRSVLVFEHCRDDILRLIGTAGSATAFMRLGNGTEAAAAADQIGRDHAFTVSQITHQLGRTDTVGGGTSDSRGVSDGESQQITNSTSGLTHHSTSVATSFTRSISDTATEMSNWSTARSVTDGTTRQRVYDFVVEPATLQALPASAFILIQGRRGRDRAVLGDCNAAIALADRVADRARG